MVKRQRGGDRMEGGEMKERWKRQKERERKKSERARSGSGVVIIAIQLHLSYQLVVCMHTDSSETIEG